MNFYLYQSMEKLFKTFLFLKSAKNLKTPLRKKTTTFKKHSSQSICMICEWVSAIFRLVNSGSILSSHQKVAGVLRASDFRLTNVLLFQESKEKCSDCSSLSSGRNPSPKSAPKWEGCRKNFFQTQFETTNSKSQQEQLGKHFQQQSKVASKRERVQLCQLQSLNPTTHKHFFLQEDRTDWHSWRKFVFARTLGAFVWDFEGCDANVGDDDDDGVGRNFPKNFEKKV